MRIHCALVLIVLAGCSQPKPVQTTTKEAEAGPKITQFYATAPNLARGEKELLCYGVENATAVTLEPPHQELTASLSRCVEVTPAETTTYRLTAEGAGGRKASQELTVTVGAARAKIAEVQVSTLNAKRGDAISICVNSTGARTVTIDPIGFRAGGDSRTCTTHQPQQTTTYVVTARGAAGDQDTERVTVKVR